jgi:hypothetical protein
LLTNVSVAQKKPRRVSSVSGDGSQSIEIPVIAVNDALTKHLFDNRTAQVNRPLTASSAPPRPIAGEFCGRLRLV